MKIYCPSCKEYSLSYREKLSLAPQKNQFTKPCVHCKKCHFKMGATDTSRFLFIVVLLLLIFAGLAMMDKLNLKAEYVVLFVPLSIVAAYFIAWPFFLIRLKKHADFKFYLPKSRVAGYGLYLVAPVLFIVGLFVLAVKLKWGM